jgi:hypothetical protein
MGGAVLATTDADVQWARSALMSIAAAQPTARTETPARSVAYAPVYYPGTTDAAGMATIRVASGEERPGIDIPLRIVALARVAGTLADGSGQPIASAMVSLVPKRGDQPSGVDGLVSSGALTLPRASVSASRFVFSGVGPGSYTLIARTGSGQRGVASPEMTLWSVNDLVMSGADREDVALRLLPGLAVTGRVVFERAETPPVDPSSLNLSFVAVNPLPGLAATYRAAVQSKGTFRVPSLAPGSYVARLDQPASAPGARWMLKSAVANGLDFADRLLIAAADGSELSGVVVTITDRAAGISGRLTNPSGQAVTRYSIVVFTQDRSLWLPGSRRIRVVRPATDGVFQATGLPAGTYALAAVENAEQTNISDPVFLDQLLPSAVTVTLSEGEKRQQDLRTGR